jgi:hypothetical protein
VQLTRGGCEEQLCRSANGVCVLCALPLYPVLPSLDKQTLQKVTILQTCIRRSKQRKHSARTVEFVAWFVSFKRCELVRGAKCSEREGGCRLDWLECLTTQGVTRWSCLSLPSPSPRIGRYNDNRGRRHALTGLAALLVVVMVAFTLIVCILLSSAFTAEETALWALSFLESVVMQILVTNSVLSLGTLVLKTAVCWALLRASRKHHRQQQAKKLSQRKEALTTEAAAAVVRRNVPVAVRRVAAVIAALTQCCGSCCERTGWTTY